MNNDEKQKLSEIKRLMIVRYPNFAQQVANAKLVFNKHVTQTAATDGTDVYFNPDFYETLTNDDDKLFIIAHELMHIKFEHMFRLTDKQGKKRDMHLWNIATDAIINANLEKDGFKIKEGYVNMPEAVNYTAEELYEKLKREQEQQKQQEQQNGQGEGKGNNQNGENQQQSSGQGKQSQGQQDKEQQNQGQGQDSQGQDKQQNGNQGQKQSGQGNASGQIQDDHGLWEEADIKRQKDNTNTVREAISKASKKQEPKTKAEEEKQIDEKSEFQKNRDDRRERAKQKLEEKKNAEFKKTEQPPMGELGEEKAILDWRLVLRREVEKSETVWSQRRSIAENNYAYRLEENDEEDEAETEVMIDVSGSVSDSMVRSFLRQLKPILKNSKLKVGFFADYTTKQFQEVKTDKDIDKLTIYRPGFGTNLDGAVRAFSKKPEVNKIVFTDGWPGEMPREDLKKTNVIWICYENRDFEPCCGKVVQVSKKSLEQIKCLASKSKPDPEME